MMWKYPVYEALVRFELSFVVFHTVLTIQRNVAKTSCSEGLIYGKLFNGTIKEGSLVMLMDPSIYKMVNWTGIFRYFQWLSQGQTQKVKAHGAKNKALTLEAKTKA